MKVTDDQRDLIIKAFSFAENAHKGIVRKYTNEPYINHCVNVALTVTTLPESTADMIAAAYLHDTVEDCDVTNEQIVELFGPVVGRYVRDLTDYYTKENFPELNRKQRKQFEAIRLGLCVNEVKSIKLADLIDNTGSIVDHDPNFAKTYLEEKDFLLKHLVGGNQELMKRAKQHVGKN